MIYSANLGNAPVVDDYLKSLSADELRDVLLALRGPEVTGGRRKEDLVRQILEGGPVTRIEQVAARVEMLSPRKHVWLFGYEPKGSTGGSDKIDLGELPEPKFFSPISALQFGSPTLMLRLAQRDESRGFIYYKFDHWVRTESWKKTTATTKELISETVRHQVVVVVRPVEKVMEVRFDGFTQGSATPDDDRLHYPQIAQDAASKVAGLAALDVRYISVASAIENLLDTHGEEIRDVRRAFSTSSGQGMALNAGLEHFEVDTASFLTQFLKDATDGRVSVKREEIRSALRSAPTTSVLLEWKKYELLTRLANHTIGPEILFRLFVTSCG
jgi:hypothetical protein